MEYHRLLLLTFTPISKFSGVCTLRFRVIFRAEYAPLPRIVYSWAISGHPSISTLFHPQKKSFREDIYIYTYST